MILSFLADSDDAYTSGEMLSGKLGLSRSAVWKCIESLRRQGYRIDAAPALGYRLVQIPDRVTPLEISPLLNTEELARTIHFEDTTGSTNEVAFEMANRGALQGTLVLCESQLKGRGRRGRSWASPRGLNFYGSLILRPDIPPSRAPELTLVAAVALGATLIEAGVSAKIKWPNDLQVEGKKIAGILTEMSSESDRVHFVILGIGVNLNATPEDFPAELRLITTSVFQDRGQIVPRALFIAALMQKLEDAFKRHQLDGFGPTQEAWEKLSVLRDQPVQVVVGAKPIRGVAQGIDDTGALWIKTSEGPVRILAGDVEMLRHASDH